MKPAWFILLATCAFGQASSDASMKQLMLDLVHPASNEILLFVNRGVPKNNPEKHEQEWAAVRRSALTLSESGNLLTIRGRAREGDWAKDAKALADVGTAAYQAAQAQDFQALAALTESLDASCTACHQQYRPNVFPREGGAK
jgi:cytochrome c556